MHKKNILVYILALAIACGSELISAAPTPKIDLTAKATDEKPMLLTYRGRWGGGWRGGYRRGGWGWGGWGWGGYPAFGFGWPYAGYGWPYVGIGWPYGPYRWW